MKYFFIALAFVSYTCFAQTPAIQLPAVIGPSPNAASIQKYGDYKVSTYTGIPGISVPLYTISLKDISVPISISYHAGGIKVDEEASRIGLGWSLNAGGTISRNILGLDDLWPYSLNPNSFDLIGFPEKMLMSTLYPPFGAHTYDISGKLGSTIDETNPLLDVDLEPDVFYYNFLGNSGKFILKKSDTSAILEDPSSNMQVKFSITPYTAHDTTTASTVGLSCVITVTTSDGTIYEFTQFESCESIGGSITVPNHITAWYLTKIQTAKGTVVNFNYIQSTTGYTYTLNHPTEYKYPYPLPSATGDTSIVRNIIPRRNYRNLLLSSITSSNCNVYFDYDSRIDIQGDKRLTALSVTNSAGALIKKISLIQDYFTSNSSGSNSFDLQTALWGGPALDSNWIKKRLKLTEVKETSADNSITLSHKFSYNDTLLPLKNSTSRDHWGYFNNAPNGGHLIPDLDWAFPGLIHVSIPGQYICSSTSNDFGSSNVIYHETPLKYYMHNYGANRKIDTNYSQAFLLNRISYPTGGYTQFSFEQNTYDKRKSFANDPNAEYYDYALSTRSLFFVTGISGIPSGFSQTFNFSITATDTSSGDGAALVHLVFNALKGGNNTTTNTTLTVISLKDASGTILGQSTFNSYSSLIDNGNGTYSPPPINARLPIGTYTLQITYGGNIVDKNSVYYTMIGSWPSLIDQNTDGVLYKYAGGLRIKNISNYTSDGSLATSINYSYHFSADSNQNGIPEIYSTGKLMERPNYFSTSPGSTPLFVSVGSEANVNVNIGYDSVVIDQNKIRHLDAYNNTCYRAGIYKSYYTAAQNEMMPFGLEAFPVYHISGIGTPNDDLWVDHVFDYRPEGVKNFYDNANGKLVKAVDYLYDSVSDTYRILKKVENTYSGTGTGTNGIIWADRIYASSSGVFYICLKGLPPIYGATNYFYPALRSIPVLPQQFTEKLYTSTDSLITTTLYSYNSNNLLKTQTEYNSKGEIVATNFKYPLDYTISGTPNNNIAKGIQNLQNKNIISPVIERYVQKSNADGSNLRTIMASFTSYKPANPYQDTLYQIENQQPLTVYNPVSITSSATSFDPNYKPKVIFNKYDTSANILEVQKVNDIKQAYLWDYGKFYPVAKCTNADSSSIAYTSFEADGSGNWTIPSAVRDTVTLTITGKRSYSLSNGAVIKSGLTASKNYIISYWTTNGSAYTITGTITGYPITGKTIGSWTYFEHKITGQTSATVSGSGNIDELRLYPDSAQMTTYTYDPLVGMTSQCDLNNKITYYEYDGLQRLKLIRDQDRNIIKNFQYNYASGCGPNCVVLPMQTFNNSNTISYPVGVFNVNKKLLGNAGNQAQYISLWNADTANQHRGTLAAGIDSMHFNLAINTGVTSIPNSVTGCRYFQYDLAYNKIDGIRNGNAAYVDFGDGTGFFPGKNPNDTAGIILPANTYIYIIGIPYFIHTYPDNTQKTLTFYHNDGNEFSGLDNGQNPATSLTLVKNVRGNYAQNMLAIQGSCYQQSSAQTIAAITNWNSITTITDFTPGNGDGSNPCKNLNYPQDFMQNNKGLTKIITAWYGPTRTGYRDTTFKISRLKSDWNTYFTQLQSIIINDDHWSRENLSALKQLNTFGLSSTTQNHEDDPNSPFVPIPSSVVDNAINQIASGAGQTVKNGLINIGTAGTIRTSASDASVDFLKSKGWTIIVNGVTQ